MTFALGNLTYTFNTATTNSCFLQPWKTWLEEVTYKPGWSFELLYGYGSSNSNGLPLYNGMNLVIRAAVSESNTGDPILIVHTFPINEVQTRDEFLAQVLYCVIKVETHEAMEYLKAGGVRVKNPHPFVGQVLY